MRIEKLIDTSVVAKLIMREENYVEAAREIEANDETVNLAIWEVTNVILKYHKRSKLSIQEGRRDLRSWESFRKKSEYSISRSSQNKHLNSQ